MDLTWTGNILLNEEEQQLTRYDETTSLAINLIFVKRLKEEKHTRLT
jgi:hypothetical protein